MAAEVGDWVKVKGFALEGEVLDVRGTSAIVDNGVIRAAISTDKLVVASRPQTGRGCK
jgi:hypothetical protein